MCVKKQPDVAPCFVSGSASLDKNPVFQSNCKRNPQLAKISSFSALNNQSHSSSYQSLYDHSHSSCSGSRTSLAAGAEGRSSGKVRAAAAEEGSEQGDQKPAAMSLDTAAGVAASATASGRICSYDQFVHFEV